jgi:hypothetical protein
VTAVFVDSMKEAISKIKHNRMMGALPMMPSNLAAMKAIPEPSGVTISQAGRKNAFLANDVAALKTKIDFVWSHQAIDDQWQCISCKLITWLLCHLGKGLLLYDDIPNSHPVLTPNISTPSA